MRHARRPLAAGSLLFLALAAAPRLHALGSLSIPLTARERLGVARVNEPVQSGVPLPRGAQLLTTSGLSVLDAEGNVVPADFDVLSRWGGTPVDATKPIKWLLVSLPVSVAANGSATFTLTDYRPASHGETLSLDSSRSDHWVVSTGAARFEIATTGFDLFHRVTIGGTDLVVPSATAGAYYTLGGSTYAASAARGGSRLSVVRTGDRSRSLTLKVKGSHRTSDDSTDEDLEFNTFLTFFAGSSAVRVQHTVQNNRPWTPLQNNAAFRPLATSVLDSWTGQSVGTNIVMADEIGLKLPLVLGASPKWTYATAASRAPQTGALGATVSLYQDNSGDASWAMWVARRPSGNDGVSDVTSPLYAPEAYVRTALRGYEIRNGSAVQESGSDANGWKISGYLDASGANGGVTVAVRDFWQNFPKALRVTAAGEVQAALFPADFRARHALRVGEQKTHDVLFRFRGPGTTDVDAAGKAFAKPLMLVAPGSWYAETTRVLPTVSTAAPNAYRFDTVATDPTYLQVDVTPQELDAYMTRHLAGPGHCPGVTSPGERFHAGLDAAISAAQLYGWLSYGDVPIDFEQEYSDEINAYACGDPPARPSVTGQYGWKYDGDYALLLNFLRSGDYRFLDYGLAAVAHTADVDSLHHGRQSGRGITDFRDGGMFGHEQHLEDGVTNPHRNGNPEQICGGGAYWNGTPTSDMLYGAPAEALAYVLTGQEPFREALLDLADWTGKYYVYAWGTDADRSSRNVLMTLAAAYELTRDPAYKAGADTVLDANAILKNPMPAAGFFPGNVGAALGLWVNVLREADDTSRDAQLATVANAVTYFQEYVNDAARADAFGWGAILLPKGKAALMSKADEQFASSVRNPPWANAYCGIQQVWQIKEWVFALYDGHAYQLAKYDQKGGPKFTPSAPGVSPQGGSATQNAPPVAAISGPPSGGTGSPLLFDGSGSTDADSTSLSYLWDFGDGATATGASAGHTYEEAGTYTVRLWVGDGESVGAAQRSVAIAFVNHAPAAAAGLDRTAPVGVSVLFDGSASSDPDGQGLTYSWDFGDGETAAGAAPRHAFPAAGRFLVTLTVSDGELTATDTAVVTVAAPSGGSVALSLRRGENGTTGVKDLNVWNGQGNYGGATEMSCYLAPHPVTRAMIAFDLSSVPAGALIESAFLHLRENRHGGSGTIGAHRVTAAWTEGTGTWGNTRDGATWTTVDGQHGWPSGNGGGDFDAAAAASAAIPGASGVDTFDITALVQDWLTGTPNHGVILVNDAPTGVSWNAFFHTSEVENASLRPRLDVTYRALTPAAGTSFRTLPPCRALDTRDAAVPLAAGETRLVALAGVCGVPAGAASVAINVTVVNASSAGAMTLYPSGESLPGTSTVSFPAGRTRANNALLGLGADGKLAVRCSIASGSADLIVDVTGYTE